MKESAPLLTPDQRRRACDAMRAYLSAPKNADGRTPHEVQTQRDVDRDRLNERELRPLTRAFLAGGLPLADFKSRVDGINKRNNHWGFSGVKGQMFFNVLCKTARDLPACAEELKAALPLPASETLARSRINTFQSYVRGVGDDFVEAGGSKNGRPQNASVPYFLSYFWQVQDRKSWPVFYTNSVYVMADLNLWQPTEDLAADYIAYKRLHEELAELFAKESGRPFDLYGVEHVFWFLRNPTGESKPVRHDDDGRPTTGVATPAPANPDAPKPATPPTAVLLPDGFVPPIVAILPRMACNEPGLEDAAKASGTNLPRAFEKSVHAAFTVLGYDTKLLGQGQGRVPDGQALEQDNSYAILWDGKVRAGGYTIGTDDRTIREYVQTQSRELKRRRSYRNIYYVIVSSSFPDECEDLIRSLKMETDVNEVCLMEAAALVAMVDAKLRNPLQLSLGPDGLQRLYCNSGILTADDVKEALA
jgi:hypothetical protein